MLIGPESDSGQHRWYFSLNNRRLWVLKRCREEGLLQATKNQILVRIREPKSQSEKERYTILNCAVEAKIMSEKRKKNNTIQSNYLRSIDIPTETDARGNKIPDQNTDGGKDKGCSSSSDESSNDCDVRKQNQSSNRFNALF